MLDIRITLSADAVSMVCACGLGMTYERSTAEDALAQATAFMSSHASCRAGQDGPAALPAQRQPSPVEHPWPRAPAEP